MQQCSSFVSSRLSLPMVFTISAEREHNIFELKAKKRRKISTERDDVGSSYQDDDIKSSMDANQSSSENFPNQTTLSGGTSLIFDMARRMLVWDDELYQGLNDASPSSEPYPSDAAPTQAAAANAAAVTSLPRWRPKSITQQSISNANPSFRTSSPIMTSAGYASILKRNSRKKNKPSMWRYCLRVYDKMGELENDRLVSVGVNRKDRNNTQIEIRGVGSNLSPSANYLNTMGNAEKRGKKRKVKLSTAHHEAALVAASKLGLWKEALLIYQRVEKAPLASNTLTAASNADGGNVMQLRSKKNRITDNMVLSVVKASVKASRIKQTTTNTRNDADPRAENESNVAEGNATTAAFSSIPNPSSTRPTLQFLTIQERRKPLDFARDIVLSMEEKHGIPLVSRHVNPLASAYLHLGLRSEAANLINALKDRSPPPPDTWYPKKFKKEKSELTSDYPRFSEGVQIVNWEDDDLDDIDDNGDDESEFDNGYESPQLNIQNLLSKDRGSYSLLVKGAVMDEDWQSAVAELQRMNDAGLHPNSSNLNSWSEVLERGCRPAGKGEVMDDNYKRSWRKRRDGIWLGNLR